MIRAITLAALLSGCLGEPERPHGVGPPIAAGSLLRHHAAVGDYNGDGYDDLALVGSEGAPGTAPTVFILLGGETLQNPDLRVDLTVADREPSAEVPQWFEGVEITASLDATGGTSSLTAISAQDSDRAMRQNDRRVYAHTISVKGRAVGDHLTTAGRYLADGVYAPGDTTMFALQRSTAQSLPAHELVYGSDKAVSVVPTPFAEGASASNASFDLSTPPYVWGAITLPAQGESQDVLIVGDTITARTAGDPVSNGSGLLEFQLGPAITLPGSDPYRFVRGRQMGDHFWVVGGNEVNNIVTLIDVDGGSQPLGFGFTANSRPDDVGIGQLGGSAAPDVAVLESGTIGVYRDLPTGVNGSLVIPGASFGSRDELPGYNVLAVGNFHGDARLEIYALSATDPTKTPLCYRMSGDSAIERCDGE